MVWMIQNRSLFLHLSTTIFVYIWYEAIQHIISRATDYKITLVFRLKAQSRAMGDTADT